MAYDRSNSDSASACSPRVTRSAWCERVAHQTFNNTTQLINTLRRQEVSQKFSPAPPTTPPYGVDGSTRDNFLGNFTGSKYSYQRCCVTETRDGAAAYTQPLLATQGKDAEAEPLHERSQTIRGKVLGTEYPDLVQSLNTRAGLCAAEYTKLNYAIY